MTTKTQHPEELLPWYVNGTLSNSEKAEVERHIGQCEQCRAEIEMLQIIRDVAKQSAEQAPPAELGWKRLARDIKKEKSSISKRAWLRPALAAAIAIIVLQSGLLAFFITKPDTVQPLGQAEPGVVLQLRFTPQTREQDMRKLLQKIDADFISGPGALDIYRVRVNVDEDDQAAINKIIQQLVHNRTMIRHVALEY